MSLSEGLAVLKLLIGRGTPAEAETIAIELELPQATTYTALAGLREAGFVELLPRSGKYAIPEDVQALFGAVAAHRLVSDADAGDGAAIARAILHAVPVD